MIKVDISRCTGCRMCETACSFYHTGTINRHMSRIKVVHHYGTGIDGPVLCQQCAERYCLDCPANALGTGSAGQVIASPTLCTICEKCQRNCPIGAVEVFKGIVYVCDLCGGSPRCVAACTEGALSFTPGEKEKISLREFKNKTKKMNSSEKRSYYIAELGRELRKKWGK